MVLGTAYRRVLGRCVSLISSSPVLLYGARSPSSAGAKPTRQSSLSSCSGTGGPDVIRKEAWPFYRKISGVRLCEELEEPKGPK